MKKIIYIVGIIFLSIVIILNALFTAHMSNGEIITVHWNNIIYFLALASLGIAIFFGTKMLDKYLYSENNEKDIKVKKEIRKTLLIAALIIYVAFCVLWVIFVRPAIVADQVHAACLGKAMYEGNVEEILPSLTYAGIPLGQYLQSYKQQITLGYVFSIFFRIIHFDEIGLLRILNLIGLFLMVFALYKICKQLSKSYKTNKVLLFTLILTFVSLPMLATFVYGDIPSLALCLWSVYFMMRYTETKNWKYAIAASVVTMIAYMMRMNSLIFIIATVIYLLLNLFKQITTNGLINFKGDNSKISDSKAPCKENTLSVLIIIMYIVISIVPSGLIQNYFLNKYNLATDKGIPTVNYLLIGMTENRRSNGWYNEQIGEYSLNHPEAASEEYKGKIKERLTYFSQNAGYAFEFYLEKISSMWAENSYSAVRENGVNEDINKPLVLCQKACLLVICICSLIVMIQNRKNLSLEILFLITIFIGGFAFHVLWEAKSRYIIPYIVVLIPVASIAIKKFKLKK